MAEGTATTTVAYLASVRLYSWETVVTLHWFNSTEMLCT
jgi:hypothetical protein